MMRHFTLLAALIFTAGAADAADWTRFRGPAGSGRVDGPPIPTTWSSKKNLKWKLPLPGKGSSSPVVADGRVYLTCYTGYGLDRRNPGKPEDLVRHVIAVDRKTGKEIWRKSVSSKAKDLYRGFITEHGYASSTPVIDGDTIYVILGESGLFAFSEDGKQLWKTDLGRKSDPFKWGDATSPIVVGDLVIVDAGVLGNHFLGVNKKTGKVAWEIKDKSFTNCWTTPTPVLTDDGPRVLFAVPKQVIAVEPKTGKKLWAAPTPLDDSTCGSVVIKDGKAYIMGSRAGHAASVSVETGEVAWKKRLRAGIVTPLIIGDEMYWSSGGLFYAASLKDGDYVYKERLPRFGGPTGGFRNATYSSPVAVGEDIVQFARDGEGYVIKAGKEFKLVSHNPAFEGDKSSFAGTPAVSDGELFVRSDKFLYCIAARAN